MAVDIKRCSHNLVEKVKKGEITVLKCRDCKRQISKNKDRLK